MLAALVVLGAGIALAQEGSANDSSQPAALGAIPGVELDARRAATSKTFRLSSGALRSTIYESPIHYRDADGKWKPIGEGLAEQSDGAGLTNGPNAFDLTLPDRMGEGPVHLSFDGGWIATRLLDSPSDSADVQGATASYETTEGGTRFELTSLANGVKEDIVLVDPSEPRVFRFALEISEGLSPALLKDGSIEFRDTSDRPLATIPAPVLLDSSPEPRVSGDAHYELQSVDEQSWELTVNADSEWFKREDLTWPTHIDPTLELSSPSLDCTFGGTKTPGVPPKLLEGKNGWGLCGSGGQKELYTRYRRNGITDEWARSLLKFDLSSIGKLGKTAYIMAATVKAHASAAAVNTSGVELRRATKGWNAGVIWNRYESFGTPWSLIGGDYTAEGTEILTKDRGSQAGWWEFSSLGLTTLVDRWVNQTLMYPNQGLMLKLLDDTKLECSPTCIERSLTFDSSAAVDTSKRPFMEVIYYDKAPSTSKVTFPSDGTRTARRLKLKAGWTEAGVTGVTFQFREGKTGSFKTISPSLVRDAQGKEPEWPIPPEGKETSPLFFDAAHATSTLEKDGGPVQVRALFESGLSAAGYSAPVEATVDRNIGGTLDATTQVGPGSVNLLTGNFTVMRSDVSIPVFETALEFSRTHSSRDPKATDTSVLGRGWTPGVPIEAAGGAEWRSVREVVVSAEEKEEGLENYVLLTDLEGYEYAFEKNGSGGYVLPPEMTGWLLTKSESGSEFSLTDPDGNRTTFENSSGGTEYLPKSVSTTGTGNKTRMVYEFVGPNRRLSKVIGPSMYECTDKEAQAMPGCRTLTFQYLPATTWGAPGTYGDRLASITYHAAVGSGGLPSMKSWQVASYKYNAEGRLTEAWDPRISPALKETYSYEAAGQLKSITPPGEEPWSFGYGAHDGEKANGRLISVKRDSLLSSPSVAQTTIAYGVPTSGTPYEMSGTTVAKWGQADIPTDATAVFPPDEVPATPPSSYSRATVYYLDAEGQLVNTATPSGAGTSAPSITTSETDEHGNVVRELSAQNRLRALSFGSESKTKSEQLDTKRVFSADGVQLVEEWGPLHDTRIAETGETVPARAYRSIEYKNPTPPSGEPAYNLPTRETAGAVFPSKGGVADQRITDTEYSWTLRKPTVTIVDPGGLKLKTRIAYNLNGQVTERSLPAEPEGKDARTTKIVYYGLLGPTECIVKPALTGLPCKVEPVKQPGTAGQPDLLVTRTPSYTGFAQPTEVIESPGGTSDPTKTRKTLTTYDEAGRITLVKREGGGVPVPTIETLYNPSTGHPTTQRFVCESGCKTSIDYSTSYGSLGTGKKEFNYPAGSAFDAQGNLWVVDNNNNRVQKLDSAGNYVFEFGGLGSAKGKLSDPMDIAIDGNGNLWVADRGNSRVQKFNQKGEYLDEFGSLGSTDGKFSSYGPRSIGIDAQGELWVSDYSGRVQEFDAEGNFIKAVGQFGESAGLDVGEGKVWVADWTKHRVSVFSAAGKPLFDFGSQGSTEGKLINPDAVEVSKGNVWVLDAGNDRIQQFDTDGKYIAQFGKPGSGSEQFSLNWPSGLAADSTGNVWVSDSGNNRIQKWNLFSSYDRQATRTIHDTLGRPISYEDADGNLSSTGYDLLSRPVITSDGKGVQTRTYDPTSGLLVQLNDSAAGTFTASYDADGKLAEVGLPNGLTAEITYDEVGAPVHLSYEKTTNCVSECTWLDFDVEGSIHGQWLNQTSTLSSQQYSYDKVGRLTEVKDTPKGGGCTTRTYNYDKNTNRESLITREPGIGGVCDISSKGNIQEYKYDAGDRLLGSEIVYDDFGRTTTLPKAYSGGGTLASTYYSNDLIRSQTQDGITNTYDLDASLRQHRRVQTGTKSGTEIYHYAAGSDSPAWIDRGSAWSRNIGGIGGELAAIEDSEKGTILQLINLHGDTVATASLDTKATKPLATFEFDEFGNPKGSSPGKFGWLGAKLRRTELPSGVIQMGVRSYVPAMGRFLSPDPIRGGSANAYEYAAGDPINNFDLTGEKCVGSAAWVKKCKALKTIAWMKRSNKNRAIILRFKSKRAAEYFAYSLNRNYLKELQQKVGKWKREELANLYRRARESRIRESLLPTDPFDCDDLGIVGVLAGTGLTLARAPMGVALVIGSATAGPEIASKAGAC
ncbi:MAG TPA: DNRLRE domain-containing protein [Solirubrobacterales bacterium]|nr:DNRLRE domain-containing protein [Solirubrobacterales bacterium]